MLTEVAKAQPVSRTLRHQAAGRVGEEDLSAVTCGAHPGGLVHVDADVSGLEARFTRMEPHSDLD